MERQRQRPQRTKWIEAFYRAEFYMRNVAAMLHAMMSARLEATTPATTHDVLRRIFTRHGHVTTSDSELAQAFELALLMALSDQGNALVIFNAWCESLPPASTCNDLLTYAKHAVESAP